MANNIQKMRIRCKEWYKKGKRDSEIKHNNISKVRVT